MVRHHRKLQQKAFVRPTLSLECPACWGQVEVPPWPETVEERQALAVCLNQHQKEAWSKWRVVLALNDVRSRFAAIRSGWEHIREHKEERVQYGDTAATAVIFPVMEEWEEML